MTMITSDMIISKETGQLLLTIPIPFFAVFYFNDFRLHRPSWDIF